ncbi:MAG: ACP S-malonyltransferase [Pseudomonadota bacterium]
MRAFIFPGQGAQTIGMAQDVAAAFPAAQAVFDEVDDALGEKLSALIWEGALETLTLTENAQPALMATSIAVMRALASEGVTVESGAFVAGHSLGEYSALCAAGALSLGDTSRLLRIRGRAMQAAVPVGEGAMAAILGLDLAGVEAVVADAAQGDCLSAANDNDPKQIVVSGVKAAVERAVLAAKEAGAKRALLLPVSAPFHCALMQPAAEAMAEALTSVELKDPVVPVVANVSAEGIQDAATICGYMIEQVTSRVRWRESVGWMTAQGVDEFVEVGAGKALSGMVRRISPDAKVRAVNTAADVAAMAGDA